MMWCQDRWQYNDDTEIAPSNRCRDATYTHCKMGVARAFDFIMLPCLMTIHNVSGCTEQKKNNNEYIATFEMAQQYTHITSYYNVVMEQNIVFS